MSDELIGPIRLIGPISRGTLDPQAHYELGTTRDRCGSKPVELAPVKTTEGD